MEKTTTTMIEWVSISERLPQEQCIAISMDCNSYCYKEILIGYVEYSDMYEKFVCENEYSILMDVTHWMPLPAPPE